LRKNVTFKLKLDDGHESRIRAPEL
jgi:hypothetical protein